MDGRFSLSVTDAMVALSLKMYSGDSFCILAIKRQNFVHLLHYHTLIPPFIQNSVPVLNGDAQISAYFIWGNTGLSLKKEVCPHQ